MKKIILIFLLVFSFFLALQFSTSSLTGVDGFYHLKMAELIRDQGIVKDFPWLKFTILEGKNYVDHHLLFHILLIPFVSFNPVVGGKLAACFFATLAVTSVFWFLQKYKIKFAFFWTLLLLFSSYTFLFRMSLVKAPALSLFFLILGLFLILKRKYLALAVLSLMFVFLYGGFFFILIFCLIDLAVFFFFERKILLKPFLFSLAGALLGLIVNPYFPRNLYFLYVQIFKTGFFSSIPVGQEWSPVELFELIGDNFLLWISFLFFGVILAVGKFFGKKLVEIKKENKTTLAILFLISFLFFILTLFSVRFIEYLVPFVVLFTAFAANCYQPFFEKAISFFKEKKWLFVPSLVFLGYFVLGTAILNISGAVNILRGSLPYNRYKDAAEWLKENTAKESIIFNADWSDFPPLFFWNTRNYYIVGLDPTFLYVYNEGLYQKYFDISRGKRLDKAASIIKNDFSSEYIFINKKRHKNLESLLGERKDFETVFQDEYSRIYKISD